MMSNTVLPFFAEQHIKNVRLLKEAKAIIEGEQAGVTAGLNEITVQLLQADEQTKKEYFLLLYGKATKEELNCIDFVRCALDFVEKGDLESYEVIDTYLVKLESFLPVADVARQRRPGCI